MHGNITGVQECAPEGDADWYKRRTTQHATPQECPIPPWAAPRVRVRLMAALKTIRTALEHPPLSLRNKVPPCDRHPNPAHARPQPPPTHTNAIMAGRGGSQSARRPRRRPAVRLYHRRALGTHATKQKEGGNPPPPPGTRRPFGVCRGRTKNPPNPHPPRVYTSTPAHLLGNKREVPAQRPGTCRTATRVVASSRRNWCRSTPKQDTRLLQRLECQYYPM